MNRPLTTTRLRITALTLDDADELVEMLMKSDLYTVIGDAPTDPRAAHDRVARWAGGSPSTDTLWINAVTRACETGRIVGMCQATVSLDAAGAAGECMIGYLVDPDHHGRGIGREMMAAFTDHLVDNLSPRTITAHIAAGHIPSERIAAALDLTLTDTVDADGERVWVRAGG